MSLKFKGEKSKKKKRSHKDVDEEDRGEGSSTGTVKERYGKNPEGMEVAVFSLCHSEADQNHIPLRSSSDIAGCFVTFFYVVPQAGSNYWGRMIWSDPLSLPRHRR